MKVKTSQQSPPKEPPTQPEVGDPLKAEEISATTERLKKLRKQLQGNRAVEAFRLADRSLPTVLSNINSKLSGLAKNRGQILLEGGNPDAELRRVVEEKKQAEQNVADLKAAALLQLDSIHAECAATVNEVSPGIWKEWQRLRKELLAMLERWGDFGERLGAPVASLAREAEQFNTAFADVRNSIPDIGVAKAPVRVPRLGRGWDWGTFKKVVFAIRQWLI